MITIDEMKAAVDAHKNEGGKFTRRMAVQSSLSGCKRESTRR